MTGMHGRLASSELQRVEAEHWTSVGAWCAYKAKRSGCIGSEPSDLTYTSSTSGPECQHRGSHQVPPSLGRC